MSFTTSRKSDFRLGAEESKPIQQESPPQTQPSSPSSIIFETNKLAGGSSPSGPRRTSSLSKIATKLSPKNWGRSSPQNEEPIM